MAITEILRPNARGDECNIAFSKCPDAWEMVDEAIADDITTHVSTQDGTYRRDIYNLSDPTLTGTIEEIEIWVRVMRDATSLSAVRAVFKAGTTITQTGTNPSPAETWVDKRMGDRTYVTNPDTGVAWTKADLTSLQAGVALKRSSAGGALSYCTQVWVVVYYSNLKFPSGESSDITRVTGIRHTYFKGTYNLMAILGGISTFTNYQRRNKPTPWEPAFPYGDPLRDPFAFDPTYINPEDI